MAANISYTHVCRRERWTNEANRVRSRTKGPGCTIVCSHVKVAARPFAPAVVIAIRISPLFGTLVLPSLVYRSAMCGSFATMPTCFRGNDADTIRPKPLFKYPPVIAGAFFFSLFPPRDAIILIILHSRGFVESPAKSC